MKEKFMEENYFFGEIDMEREYLINDMISQEREYEEYVQLKQELNRNTNDKPFTKIEVQPYVNNRPNTKIEIAGEEKSIYHQQTKRTKPGF